MTQALMEAELDAEAEQYVEGLALAMNVNVNSSNIKQEVINKLKAQCEVTATTNPEQIYEFDGIKCINSDWPLPEVRQYGDATADCLVKQLVQNSLDAEAKTKVTQKNIGLNPAAVAPCLLPILVFGGIGFVFSRKGGANKKNFNNCPFRPPSATGPNARNGMYNFGTNGRKENGWLRQVGLLVRVTSLAESPRKTKKFEARVYDERDGKSRSVHFGAKGYSDYTKHLDGERKRRYLTRHGADRSRQDWTKRGILTPGFWALAFVGRENDGGCEEEDFKEIRY